MEDIYLEYKSEIIEHIEEIEQTKLKPSYLALTSLFKIYKRATKRNKCFSCRGDRAFIYEFFKEKVNKWITQ